MNGNSRGIRANVVEWMRAMRIGTRRLAGPLIFLLALSVSIPENAGALSMPAVWRYIDNINWTAGVYFNDGDAACRHAAGPSYNTCVQGYSTYSNARWYASAPTSGYGGCIFTVTNWGVCPNANQVYEPVSYSNWVSRNITCPWPLSNNGYGVCVGADDVTPPNMCPITSNPVQISNGWKYWSETDFTKPFEFKRYYTSRPSNGFLTSGLGQQWRHTYDRSIVATTDPTKVWVLRPEGTYIPFSQDSSGNWTPYFPSTFRLSSSGSGYAVTSDQDEQETYDSFGVLLSIKTREGRLYTLQYASSGFLASVTDDQGRALVFTLTSNRANIASVTAPGGTQLQFQYTQYAVGAQLTGMSWTDVGNVVRQRTYHYENAANASLLTGITDESGQRYSTYTYDAWDRVQSTALWSDSTHQVNVTTFGYPSATSRTVTSPLSGTSTYSFALISGAQRMTGSTQPCASCGTSAQSVSYDSGGYPQQIVDFNGNVTRQTFDTTRGLETQRIEAYGTARQRTTNTTWHTQYRVPLQRSVFDGANVSVTISKWTYNSGGQVASRCEIDPLVSGASAYVCGSSSNAPSGVRQWTYTYCEEAGVSAGTCPRVGVVLTMDGPRTDIADATSHSYYLNTDTSGCSTATGPCHHRGDLQATTDSLGHTITVTRYTANGQPSSITDANGVVTTLTYDMRQRLTSRSVAGETTSFDYWPTGLLKKVTLPDGSYLMYDYDAAHRLTDLSDADGNHVHYTLDAMGNRTKEESFDPSSALTQTRTRAFNALNQLYQEIGAAGGAAVTTTYGYDNNGNQTSIAAPLARNSTQGYDELNRLTSITDPASGLMSYGYNALDQLISVTDPRNLTTTYTHNALGDLKQQVSPDTGTTTNTFDSGGNLKTSTDARAAISTYTYDALNRVTSVAFKKGSTTDQTITYTYDAGTNAIGRLTGASDSTHSLAWIYDAPGRITSKQQTVGTVTRTVGYGYTNGHLTSLTTPSGQSVTYGYTNGKVTSIAINGATLLSSVLYEPFGPVRQWSWGNGTLAVRTYDEDGNINLIDSAGVQTYSYDDAFRITGVSDASVPSLSWTYGRDLLDRLTTATSSSQALGWTHDSNGNRLTQTGSAQTLTYPSTSNRVSSIAGTPNKTYTYDAAGKMTGDGTRTFAYNNRGRMKSTTSGSTTISYTYNALGQRIKKTGTTRLFVYDEGAHLLGEYNSTGGLVQETIWFGDIPVATLRPKSGGGIDIFYVHTDHLNTPRKVTRPSDNKLRWRWDPTPFGTGAPNENPQSLGAFNYNLRFQGTYADTESSLFYNYFRDCYDPATGRYCQPDPIGLNGGINPYAYAQNDPVTLVDPLGLLVWRNSTTYAFDLVPGSRWAPFPGARPFPSGQGAAGNTLVDWTIKSRCVCSGSEVKFEEFTVDFRTNVHIRPGLSDIWIAYVKLGEADHIGDYNGWANTKGKQLAVERENRYKALSFGSIAECEELTSSSLDAGLRGGIREPYLESTQRWDYPGGPHGH